MKATWPRSLLPAVLHEPGLFPGHVCLPTMAGHPTCATCGADLWDGSIDLWSDLRRVELFTWHPEHDCFAQRDLKPVILGE